jgi:hypothetical protein
MSKKLIEMRIGLRIRHIDNPDTLGVITWISKTTMSALV